MLNLWKDNAITRITASATAVSVAMLACALSAPRQAAAQAQPTQEGVYIAFETPDRGTIGADVHDPQSILDGTRMNIEITGSNYVVEVTRPAAEPRVLERIDVFSGTSLAARAEAWSDGTIILQDPITGAQYTGAGQLEATSKMYNVFGPNVLLIMEERFQQSLYDLGYLAPDSGPQANIVVIGALIAACCLKVKAKYSEKDGWEGEVGWDCSCL